MERDELSPEQEALADANYADFEKQLLRVGVDLRAAMPNLHQAAPVRSPVSSSIDVSDEYFETFTIDMHGIAQVLKQLPDGAGNAAFVAAYNNSAR